jgi:hypothetical protein
MAASLPANDIVIKISLSFAETPLQMGSSAKEKEAVTGNSGVRTTAS